MKKRNSLRLKKKTEAQTHGVNTRYIEIKLCLVNFLLLFYVSFVLVIRAQTFSNSFVIEVPSKLDKLKAILEERFSLTYRGHIHSNFFLFVKTDLPKESDSPWESEEFKKLLEEQSASCEQEIYRSVRHFDPDLSKRKKKRAKKFQYGEKTEYAMGIHKAWSKDHNGKGVVIAVVDSGVQIDHNDLKDNVDMGLSCDFTVRNRKGEKDCSHESGEPREWQFYPELFPHFDHGTNCAGLIAAIRNDVCATGVAPNATIASLLVINPLERMVGSTPAGALSHKTDVIDIYSNSWGTTDSECGFLDISNVTKSAFQKGVEHGRNGKGSIYVFPSGNGENDDNCNADAYANSIFTLTIGSVDRFGKIPEYAEPCPCVLASTFGSGSKFNKSYLMTTSLDHKCTKGFTGTSASAAMASGIIALVLGVNPNLTKRDIEHIIVKSTKPDNLDPAAGWKINGANNFVSDYFGFGLMDADAMIREARTWKAIPASSVCSEKSVLMQKEINGKDGFVRKLISTSGCIGTSSEVESLEYVQLELRFRTLNIDKVSIELTSPMGTTSTLLTRRSDKCQPIERVIQWKFTSVQFWGENPKGVWILRMSNIKDGVDYQHSTEGVATDILATLILRGFSSKVLHIGMSDNSQPVKASQGSDIWDYSEYIFHALVALVCILICIALVVVYLKSRQKQKEPRKSE